MLKELLLMLELFHAEKVIVNKDFNSETATSIQAVLPHEEAVKLLKEQDEKKTWQDLLVLCSENDPEPGKDTFTIIL